jgi:hypothetical protein
MIGERPTARRGEVFDRLSEGGAFQELDRGASQTSIARKYNTTQASVGRSYVTYQIEKAQALIDWDWTSEQEELVPKNKLALARALAWGAPVVQRIYGTHESSLLEVLTDEMADAYNLFQERFFEVAPGMTFIVKPFHRAWIKALIRSWLTGTKEMILSPPRHGKSEMLVRFVVWAVAMDPNVRVMWVAANEDVASIMLGAVKDHLENNEELIRFVLPPGDVFAPGRNKSRPWSGSEIKIVGMNILGQKSSTMLALGLRAKVLSRDVDILIVDDLEDFDSTREPSGRLYGRNKFAEIGTRKEERTAWFFISSRQHPEDLAHNFLESGSQQGWNIQVSSAHEDCQLDPDLIEGHDQNGCVLFPEVRSYRWLLEKKHEMDELGLPGAYEMRYLNLPRPTRGLIFRVETIRELCLDRSRDIGIAGIPPGRMIGGLDPASRGTQAGFAWLWTPEMLYMIDLETQEAGGFEGALRLMTDWDIAYDLKDWKYEDNSQQIEFFRDPRLAVLSSKTGISVKPYQTGKNKQDPELGISAMAPLYHGGKINLPYGTSEARRKVNAFLRQLENWTTEGKRNRAKTDIRMASWFPFPSILRWGRDVDAIESSLGLESSYPGVVDTVGQVPWQETRYPGRGM